MAFVKLTWTTTKAPIHINVDHVAAVYQDGEGTGTILALAIPQGNGVVTRAVSESVEDVIGRFTTAQFLTR
jgi:hypothetical protein